MRFEVFYDHQDRQWRWVLKDVHDSSIAVSSSGFHDQENCVASINIVRRSMQAKIKVIPLRNLPESED